jgi:hypothetical protein
LENGGYLFVSGAEIGWDLIANGSSSDTEFYNDYLMAEYISDAPNNQSSTYYTVEPIDGEIFEGLNDFLFDNGTHGTIDVDWPDAIRAAGSASNVLKYDNVPTSSGYAGVSYSGSFGGSFFQGKLVHLSFPFETIINLNMRTQLIQSILEFFDQTVEVDNGKTINDSFVLDQNYPNPFNPSTTIKYRIPFNNADRLQKEKVTLKVYDLLGREVVTLIDEFKSPGEYSVEFNINSLDLNLSSGTYVYRLTAGSLSKTLKMLLIK